MPRTARFDGDGVTHHVLLRGIERRDIFADDGDRREFTSRLSLVLDETRLCCFAAALMPNHVHLVVRTGDVPLATAMARLGTGYAQAFNRRHGRVGHLFQNRYKAIWVRDDAQLVAAIRYVHLNPLRGGIVPDVTHLERFPWTGHAQLMGAEPAGWIDVGATLSFFGATVAEARSQLRDLMARPEADAAEPAPPIAAGLAALVSRACFDLAIDRDAVARGGRAREVSRARALIAHTACDLLQLANAEVANALGVSDTAVAKARRRGADLAARAPWSACVRGWVAATPPVPQDRPASSEKVGTSP